jgi:hypothetical protein
MPFVVNKVERANPTGQTSPGVLKMLFAAITFMFITMAAYSQKITSSPDVNNDSSGETSIMPITSVVTELGNEKVTMVTFQYATTLFKSWISLDSKTFLTVDNSSKKYQILDWGSIIDIDIKDNRIIIGTDISKV